MSGLVEGKVGLVTGAGSGIGRATAELLAREGAQVLVCDVDEAGGEAAAKAIEAAGGRARFLRTDVTSEADVEAAVRACVEGGGRLDFAVNNAGITGRGAALHQLGLEDWSRTLGVNLTGVFLCLKHELAAMQPQRSGSIVNVASGAGVIGVPGLAHYCASKHGVLGLTKTAAIENAALGVRVNAICPGSTDTPLLRSAMGADPNLEKLVLSTVPAGRLGRPEEIAEAALWLCSDRSGWVTGDSLFVDGASVAR